MKPSDEPWCAVLSAAAIPAPWWLAVVLAEGWQCGFGPASEVGFFAAFVMVIAMVVAALIATVVVRAWRGPLPVRIWYIACCAVASGAAIYGVLSMAHLGGCDLYV